jgi:hypothetical protein
MSASPMHRDSSLVFIIVQVLTGLFLMPFYASANENAKQI